MCSKKWLKYIPDIKGLLYICSGLYNFKKSRIPCDGKKVCPVAITRHTFYIVVVLLDSCISVIYFDMLYMPQRLIVIMPP